MTATGTIMFQDDSPALAVGAARGWKVGFGYADAKGSVVMVYVVTPPPKPGDPTGTQTNAREIPKLTNGKADVNAISSYLAGFGVTLTNALKSVIGA